MSLHNDEDDDDGPGGANIVLLRGAAVATVLAVVVAAILIITFNSGGGSAPHAAASATVTDTTGAGSDPSLATTTTATATVTLTRTARPRSATSASRSASAPTTGAASPAAGSRFTATPPAGFAATEHVVSHGRYVESRWDAGAEYAVVDMSPRSGLPPAQAAAGVIRATSAQPGYQLISVGPGRLSHSPSEKWVFRLGTTERVDFFFSACGHDFGVLGVTTPARFAARLPAFSAVADSVRAC